METAVAMDDPSAVTTVSTMDGQDCSKPDEEAPKSGAEQRRRPLGRRTKKGKRRGIVEKRRGLGEKKRGQRPKRRGQEEKKEGVTVKRTWSGGKRRWDKKHYCVFCRRPQVKIARHLLRKHGDEQEVVAASALPPGSKQRHLLLEHLRCRGNYLHNIEVIRQGSGEIVPWRQPSEEVDARNYLPCPLCLGFFLRADLWKHQVSCRKKLAISPSKDSAPSSETTTQTQNSEFVPGSKCDQADSDTTENGLVDPPGEPNQTLSSGRKRTLTSDLCLDQNLDAVGTRPRKRTRVQAAASRLLPISSGASESCSEILHRMNQDSVSYEVKSDRLICQYGNKLMGNQDGNQKRYDYVSQKLRELGRLLLAAKSLDPGVQTLQDLLAPGQLSLVLSAARKSSGYRWTRPPLAVKTTLKTVCEIAIGESMEDGDWETAAKTTDFYHMLGRDWDNLQSLDQDPAGLEGEKVKKHPFMTKNQKDSRLDGFSKNGTRSMSSVLPSDSRLQNVSGPPGPRKVRRRPWTSAEKEAIWRQLGVHVLVQSVPGKEVCQRCLDLEPVLRGRHWKDIKNQIHNQIQSQKKQQFHAQMDQEEIQDHRDQQKNQQYQSEMDMQTKEHPDLKRPEYHLGHHRLDQQDPDLVLKKNMYQIDHQSQSLQTLDRGTPGLTVSPYVPNGTLRTPGLPLLERDSTLYPLLPRAAEPHLDQILTRPDWTEEALVQNYPVSRSRNLMHEVPPGPPPDPHPGHVHF